MLRSLVLCSFAWLIWWPAVPMQADVVVVDREQQQVLRYASSHALLIGNSRYDHWRELPSIPGELGAVRAVLEEHEFEVEVAFDLGELELRQTVDRFIKRYGFAEDNRLLIYFAGHGWTRTVDGGVVRGYLVPTDAPQPVLGAMGAFERKAVTMYDVEAWARRITTRHALFLFDSCFSGSVFETRSDAIQPGYISTVTAKPVRHFLTAGGAKQEVPATSLFAPALVQGLRGGADLVPDGYITGTELYTYLQARASGEGLTPLEGKLPRYREGEFVFRVPFELAPTVTFAIDDLRETAEQESSWLEYQRQMDEAFATVDGLGGSRTTRAEALRRFTSSFERDNPYSTRDDDLRLRAASRLEELSQSEDSSNESAAPRRTEPQPGDLWVDPAIGMQFRYIPSGTFMMGSPPDESGRFDDETQHEVTLTRGYWMGETEVTQAQWHRVMKTNPSRFESCGATCPVEQVSWYEAVAYANALSESAGFSPCYTVSGSNGKKAGEGLEFDVVERREKCSGYRLPTEAEWERAARAGASTALYTGGMTIQGERDSPELDTIAWYGGNSQANYSEAFDCSGWTETQVTDLTTCGPQPVGGKKINTWAVHDVLGNVWEWCEDSWSLSADYAAGAQTDPLGTGGSSRVIRGGSWRSLVRDARAAVRGGDDPGARYGSVGFRLARGQGPEARTEQNSE